MQNYIIHPEASHAQPTEPFAALADMAEARAIREGHEMQWIPHAPPAGHGATRVQGTSGRTYGGACDLVHIPDHHRRDVGRMVGEYLERLQRLVSIDPAAYSKLLCPGCYMIAVIDSAIWLAENNGQSLAELGATMARAFQQIAESGSYDESMLEEIQVIEAPEYMSGEYREPAGEYPAGSVRL